MVSELLRRGAIHNYHMNFQQLPPTYIFKDSKVFEMRQCGKIDFIYRISMYKIDSDKELIIASAFRIHFVSCFNVLDRKTRIVFFPSGVGPTTVYPP